MKSYLYLILIIFSFILILFPEIDIHFSKFFYDNHTGFYLKHNAFINLVTRWVTPIGNLTSILLLIRMALSIIKEKSLFKTPHFALLVALLLGPGLLVNYVLKENFGRARPSQIKEFKGSKQFSPPFSITTQCHHNCSFSSGHAAMGFYYTAFAFAYRRIFLFPTIILGLIIGGFRIMQGAHFLSDVYFSALFVIFINFACVKFLYNKR